MNTSTKDKSSVAYYLTPEKLERDRVRNRVMRESVERCDLLLGHAQNLIDRIDAKMNGEDLTDEGDRERGAGHHPTGGVMLGETNELMDSKLDRSGRLFLCEEALSIDRLLFPREQIPENQGDYRSNDFKIIDRRDANEGIRNFVFVSHTMYLDTGGEYGATQISNPTGVIRPAS